MKKAQILTNLSVEIQKPLINKERYLVKPKPVKAMLSPKTT
jgi:hypothetical protein